MGTGIFSTGITGLQVAQLGLLTTEHNIANAKTAGYNRQRTVQATNVAMLTGSGYVGQGAHVETIERMYDSFLSNQVNRTQTASSELEVYYAQIKKIDNLLVDSDVGVATALQDFFDGIQEVSANPSQLTTRQAMISSAQMLASRYQGLANQINQLYAGVNGQIQTVVASINSYSAQIADLNSSIVVAQSSISQPPNDLLDQRDQLILELNKLVKVTTTTNSDGTFNVYIGNGQQLVVGTQVMTMTAQPSDADPSRFVVGLSTAGGSQEIPESLITGGSLGGLIHFRSETLDKVANDLGRNAASLALTFNAQHALGQDLLGQSVGDANFADEFFTLSAPKVVANANNSTVTPAVITSTLVAPSIDGYYTLALNAAGTTYTLTRQSDGTAWTGGTLAALKTTVDVDLLPSEDLRLTGATVAAGTSTQVLSSAADGAAFYTKLTSSDYRLSRNGANFTVTRLSDNTQWTDTSLTALSATVANSEGFSFSLASGAMASGDSFIIQPARNAAKTLSVSLDVASDARLIAAAMPIRTTASTANTGSGAISAGNTTLGFGSPAITSDVTFRSNSTGTQLTVTGLPAGANISVTNGDITQVYSGPTFTYSPGATISIAGVSFSISGNLSNNDTFTLTSNSAGVSDARNALLLSQLQTKNTMSGETASFASAYAQLVSDCGNKSREVQVKSEAQSTLLQQSEDARDSLSAVNLDEEAANLMRYQQAYQASAKALQLGNSLFGDLLAIMS